MVWANEDIGWRLITLKRFEEAEIAFLMSQLNRGGVFLDVGANIGLFSLPAARKVGAEGKVLALEPFKRNALVLSLAAELNDISNEVLSVVERPVSSVVGQSVCMTVPEGDGAYGYIAEADDGAGLTTTTVDALLSELGVDRVDVMKIDVEGAELRVLKGAHELFGDRGRAPRVVMVEVIPEYLLRFDDQVNELFSFMSESGYAAFYLRDTSLAPILDANAIPEHNVFFVRAPEDPRTS